MASFSTQKACISLSSSSSSSMSQWKYEVFLSFCGEDTRKNFTDHLYAALIQKGINVYRDNENLEQGNPIASGLMKAIEESQYAIIILSKNYAFSKWCLNELVKILECMKEKGLRVRPIFYHVNPSDVGNQRESFEKAFLKPEEDRKVPDEQIKEWRSALKEVSKIRGRHLVDSYESEVIQEITKSIFDELIRECQDVSEHLVGINSRVNEMMDLFGTMSDDVHFIGIWGMPGIGKTTLARVVYNRIFHQFEASSFICNVRETVEKHGLVYLQKQLLTETLKVKEVNIWNHVEGIKVIKKGLVTKKVLIVIDDVDKDEQLQALVGSCDWFGLGSRIIVTSKDKHLLERHRVDTIHRTNGLASDEALELFSWTVFNQSYPEKDFVDLSKDIVEYAKGLPLALKVLGSSLIGRQRKVWEDYQHQLEEIRKGEILDEGEILDKLEISYRGLNDREQNLFLDIACFFKGEDENRVAHIEGSGCYKNIETLKDKSLITILGRKLWMHDLIQKMAWRIVHRESPQEPGGRSRLWLCKDVFHVLKEQTGTKFVKGMMLSSPPHKENLNAEAFSNMKSLRLIKICNVHLPDGLNFVSNKLLMMEWHDYPLKFMPINFQPDELVELIMPCSHIEQLPEGFNNLAKLRLLDLSDSKDLVKTPNFNGLLILERLIFQGCTRLDKLDLPVGSLKQLTLLNLKACKSMKSLPYEINLESLEIFILSGCSSLKKISEIGTNMTRLLEFYLDGTAVEELPSSIENLTGLTILSLQDCKNLSSFPNVNLPSLKTLNLSGCMVRPPKSWLSHGLSLIGAPLVLWTNYFFSIRKAINTLLPMLRFIFSLNLSNRDFWDGGLPNDLSGLSLLQDLDLSKNNFTRLPDSISQLSKLKYLTMNDCTMLQSLPELPLSIRSVKARRCPALEKYSNQSAAWTSGETGFTLIDCECKDGDTASIPIPSLPYDDIDPFWERFVEDAIVHQNKNFYHFSFSTEIPEWFCYRNHNSSVTIPLPSDLHDNSSWIGVALFTVVVIHKNLNSVSSVKDCKPLINFICKSDMVEGLVDCPLDLEYNIFEVRPEIISHESSFGLKILIPAGKLRDHLKECSCVTALITTGFPYIKIKSCAGRMLYRQDLVKCVQSGKKINQIFEFQVDKVESSLSNGQSDLNVGQKGKLKSLLLRLYQGDLALNHKYDYVFPHKRVPNWFTNRSFCSEIRINLPRNLQYDERWMGIAVCACYAVHKQPTPSGDNQDLTSFLNFYNPLVSHRVRLTRHRIFQESKDIFIESSHRILVLYIPQLLFRLEECCHIGALFEAKNPGVLVKECGIELVYKQNVEEFVQTLVQCMLTSPHAYHEFFYRNLSHQVEERAKGEDFGRYSSLKRMPQPLPKLLPSIENITEGWSSSEMRPSSFVGYLEPPTKGKYESIMSSESLIKACLQKNFDEGEIFNCCFAEREIPQWFYNQRLQSMEMQLSLDICNDPDWMGIALCALFLFRKHPTAVRMNLDSRDSRNSEFFQFGCDMQTNSFPWRLVCPGILTTENILVSLDKRAFIWVLFIPRTAYADLWYQSGRMDFRFQSSIPDLVMEKYEFNVVYRQNMEELTRIMAQCSAPFDSFLDSCDPGVFYYMWLNYPELFIGTKSSYADLHPRGSFISQEETSGNAQYSFAEDPYPHDHFRCFHPSTSFNSCFPTRRIPKWYYEQSPGYSVTIDIPPNLCDDSNWLGLALYASFAFFEDHDNSVSENSLHFLYCQLQTSKAGLDDQILVCRTTNEENMFFRVLCGNIWICYIPGVALIDMLDQGGDIEASFASDWPCVAVPSCGLRFFYEHDLVQFEQELGDCNALISAHRNLGRRLNKQATKLETMKEISQLINNVKTIVNENDRLAFDGCSKYSYCFPPVEILHCFNHRSDGPAVKIDMSNVLCNDNNWMGFVLCASFSIDEHQTEIIENLHSAIPHHLICLLETDVAGSEQVLHFHDTTKEEFMWLDTEGGFLWLSYIPRCSFPDRFNQCTWIETSIISDWPGVTLQKCGLSFDHVNHSLFQQIKIHCDSQYFYQGLDDQLMASYKAATSRTENQLSKNEPNPTEQCCQCPLLDFDRCNFYNLRFPRSEILEWFSHRSDEGWVKIPLPPNLYNDDTWMGLALCAFFVVEVNQTADVDILDSETRYDLVYHLDPHVGSVRSLHRYRLTEENLMMLQQGGLIWLSYVERGSLQNCLSQCSYITASITAEFPGLKVKHCGLRLLYRHDVELFKQTIGHCMKSSSYDWDVIRQLKIDNGNKDKQIQDDEGKSSRTSSSWDESHFKSLRGPIDPKDKGKRVLE